MQSNIQMQKTGLRDIGRSHDPLPASDLERWPELMHLLIKAGALRSMTVPNEQPGYSPSIISPHYFDPKKSLRISFRLPCFLGFHSGSVWLS